MTDTPRWNGLRIGMVCFVLLGMGAVTPLDASESACPLPISTCSDTNVGAPCPRGYECVCIPSCPNCRDCPARVCVPRAVPDCTTACDCEPGLGCFDRQCIAGFAPVFCCPAAPCPAGEQCQFSSGDMARCEPSCEELVDAANARLERIVSRAGRCRADAECVHVDTTTQCAGACGAWVHERYVRFVERAISYIDARICAEHRSHDCPYATPRCQQQHGVCDRGRCRGALGPAPLSPNP